MRSGKMSLPKKTRKKQFFDCNVFVMFRVRAIFCWKPHPNWPYGTRAIIVSVLLKIINKGYWMLLFVMSNTWSKYLQVPTHFAWVAHHEICYLRYSNIIVCKREIVVANYSRMLNCHMEKQKLIMNQIIKGTAQSCFLFKCSKCTLKRDAVLISSQNWHIWCSFFLLQTIYSMAVFPFPHLNEIREKYMFSITPFSPLGSLDESGSSTPGDGGGLSPSRRNKVKKSSSHHQDRPLSDDDINDMEEMDGSALACFTGLLPAPVSPTRAKTSKLN